MIQFVDAKPRSWNHQGKETNDRFTIWCRHVSLQGHSPSCYGRWSRRIIFSSHGSL